MELTVDSKKRVYLFGNNNAEGDATMKPLLGGKGANLAEMERIGLPVPPGFTITTDVCTEYNQLGSRATADLLGEEILGGIDHIEKVMDTEFGSNENPCLLSVRSGARDSMPGMMDTVLNIGLNDESVVGLAKKTGKDRFAWDSYRRFIQMYGDVVMDIGKYFPEDTDPFEDILEDIKKEQGYSSDREYQVIDLKEIVSRFKSIIRTKTGKEFPSEPMVQLWNSIVAVFESWHTERAVYYRKINRIPSEWGTAVNVQAMVFGNMGDRSASGVAFTRNAATGENAFNGEYLIDAQGEDVVAGIRTPLQITKVASIQWAKLAKATEEKREQEYPSLEEYMPEIYQELDHWQNKLEAHFRDMQDLEFTIEENRLWILQTRNGKRTGSAMIKIAMDMHNEGLIDKEMLVKRIDPNKITELLLPVFDKDAREKANVIATGLPASPGAATGQIVFTPEKAEEWKSNGKDIILVRIETSADDLKGMDAANGILTMRGGMTSHAAVVARGMGKCCVSGAGNLKINYADKIVAMGGKVYKEGDWISLNGASGEVYEGKLNTTEPDIGDDLGEIMDIADIFSSLKVRANADTPESASLARSFGAKGIGLCRTEHMFFAKDRINVMREMIITDNKKEALDKLMPMQREDFEGILEAMQGLPVTIRLLDPPLHEFVPMDEASQRVVAENLGLSFAVVNEKIENLKEMNPMLGHRGCRLGNTYPEITRMQGRAIIEAALNLKERKINALPEIMIPLTGSVEEVTMQKNILNDEIRKVFEERDDTIEYSIGTMIEVPRAALMASEIAKEAEFFSFGTNDLTQMAFGFSRDDIGSFLPTYLEKGLLKEDPFEFLDQNGVGQLVEMGVKNGRKTNPNLEIGICGEHGGEPRSIAFCHKVGMDYVSCSPFRVPVARIAAARANIESN